MSSTPAPGWYPDPEIPGHIRYWDGASWMAGTSQPAQPAQQDAGGADGVGGSEAPAQDPKRHDGKLVIPGEVVAARSVPLAGPGAPPNAHDATTRPHDPGRPGQPGQPGQGGYAGQAEGDGYGNQGGPGAYGGVPHQASPGYHHAPAAQGPGGHAPAAEAVQQPGPTPWRPPASPLFETVERRPAGFGRRVLARVADLLVPLAAGAGVAALVVPSAVDHIRGKVHAVRYAGQDKTVWLVDGTTLTAAALVAGAFVVAMLVYEALPTWKWGRSLGKTLFGLRVVDIESHDTPGFGQVVRRWLVFGLLSPVVVGFLAALWGLFDRPWRQGWHDKAARTFVAHDH